MYSLYDLITISGIKTEPDQGFTLVSHNSSSLFSTLQRLDTPRYQSLFFLYNNGDALSPGMSDFGKQKSMLSYVGSGLTSNGRRGKVSKRPESGTNKSQIKHVQMHLDLGQVTDIRRLYPTRLHLPDCHSHLLQKHFAPSRCKSCGMLYSKGSIEDEKAHDEFHKSSVHGFRFQVVQPTICIPHVCFTQ